jgi:arginase
VLLATVPALKGVGGHAGLLHLDAHEDATRMADSDSGEAANMEIRLLTGLDGERPAADMPVPLPALDPDAVAMLGVRDATWRDELDLPSVGGRLFIRTAEQVSGAPRDCVRDAVAHLQAVTPAWWLHVDLDVLSWQEFRACGAPGETQLPGGLSWETLTIIAGAALRSSGCRGWSMAIYNPDLDPDRSAAKKIVALARMVSEGALTPA